MGISANQKRIETLRALDKIKTVIKHPQFLKFAKLYASQFIRNSGYGKWIVEYQDMLDKGHFSPEKLREQYIKYVLGQSTLDFQRRMAVYSICVLAEEATSSYIEIRENSLYSIIVFTGEVAYDDDDDPYVDLSYDEAIEICKALNEEAEEELFKIKKQ